MLCKSLTLTLSRRERDPKAGEGAGSLTTVLALDTATGINSVAVLREQTILAETVANCQRLHSERLLETIRWTLREADFALAEIDLFAVSTGPGSFTGLRIGAATAKGLAYAAGKPLVAVPTLDALAATFPLHNATVCVMIDARMREVYGAVYRYTDGVRETLAASSVGPLEQLLEPLQGEVYFLGDAVAANRDKILAHLPKANLVPERAGIPRASAVAAEGLQLARQGAPTDAALLAPVYLRQSQAEIARAARA